MRSAIRTWVVGRRHEIVLFIVMTLVAWIGLDFLLALAGVPFLLDLWEVNSVKDSAAKGQIVAAATAWVGASLGLWTFFVNVWEKRRAHEEQLQKDREIANEQRRADREALAAQLQKDREVAELQRLEERFNQLSDDFSQGGSESLLARVNAAIGLADLAVRPRPGLSEEELAAKAADHPEEAYPFFRRAAMQLSAALYLYSEPEARAQVRKAIRAMAEFTHQRQPNLCPVLTNQVAHANRAAKSALLGVIAMDWSRRTRSADPAVMGQDRDNYLNELAELLAPTEVAELNREVADYLLEEASNQKSRVLSGDVRAIGPNGPLAAISRAWNVLTETRDTIAACLPQAQDESTTGAKDGQTLKGADLSGCFLAGANFSGKTLREARLAQVVLVGASLTKASFQETDLRWASLRNTTALDANFEKANFYDADLINANFTTANMRLAILRMARLNAASMAGVLLTGADLSFADVVEARLSGAQLQYTNLKSTDFGGSTLTSADLRYADARGAMFKNSSLGHALMQGANLVEASFCANDPNACGQKVPKDWPKDWRKACFARKDPNLAKEERLAEQTWQQMLRLWLPEGEEPPPRPDIAYDDWQAARQVLFSEFLEAEGQASGGGTAVPPDPQPHLDPGASELAILRDSGVCSLDEVVGTVCRCSEPPTGVCEERQA